MTAAISCHSSGSIDDAPFHVGGRLHQMAETAGGALMALSVKIAAAVRPQWTRLCRSGRSRRGCVHGTFEEGPVGADPVLHRLALAATSERPVLQLAGYTDVVAAREGDECQADAAHGRDGSTTLSLDGGEDGEDGIEPGGDVGKLGKFAWRCELVDAAVLARAALLAIRRRSRRRRTTWILDRRTCPRTCARVRAAGVFRDWTREYSRIGTGGIHLVVRDCVSRDDLSVGRLRQPRRGRLVDLLMLAEVPHDTEPGAVVLVNEDQLLRFDIAQPASNLRLRHVLPVGEREADDAVDGRSEPALVVGHRDQPHKQQLGGDRQLRDSFVLWHLRLDGSDSWPGWPPALPLGHAAWASTSGARSAFRWLQSSQRN